MQNNRAVTLWLLICCISVAMMVALGGVTRLTDSGLSIMTWEPLSGALPPLTEEKWESYFETYQQIPEYKQTNKGMTLEEFKGIFWLEYFHRLMGRVAGLIFLIPFIYFVARKKIKKNVALKLGGVFALGGLQGFIGWYMVSSGFADRTDVSQYRLALHLGMAFLIFALLWHAYLGSKDRLELAGKRWYLLPARVYFMVILGAFVAGTDAGFAYNTFPMMDGKLIPDGLYILEPKWRNHFENVTMVQFQHRVYAILLTAAIIGFAIKMKDRKNLAALMLADLAVQIGLGIATLYSFGSFADYDSVSHAYQKVLYTPVILAAAHQLNALILFAITIRVAYRPYRE